MTTKRAQFSAPRFWRPFHPSWLLLHGICLALAGIAWVVDHQVFQWTNRWYNGPTPLNGELHQLILSLAMYGQMLGIVMALALIFMFDIRRRGRVFILGMMILGAGIGCWVLKTTWGRERPLTSQGKTVLHGPVAGARSQNQSFPSGHTATAFAMSVGLARFYPHASPLFWALAAGVGVNRLVTVRHFLSDVVVGAWFGYAFGAWILGLPWMWKISRKLNYLARPKATAAGELPWRERIENHTWSVLTSPWLLLAVSLTIHWAGNGATGLWDRDEPRFAGAAREMVNRGDWLVPTFNGELRPDKPILVYWLIAVATKIFGDGPFAARFFSGIGGSLSAVLVYFLGRRMFNAKVGLLAGWIFALSPMLIVESKLATADAILLLLLTSATYLLWRHYEGELDWRLSMTFWAVLGLAVLQKGPVALAVVGMTAALFCGMLGEFRWLSRLRCWRGLAVLLAVLLPWGIAVQWATDGDFLSLSLGHHVVQRSTSALEGHSGFPGFYLITLLGLMGPWSWAIPWSIQEHWGRVRTDARLLFLAAWAIGPLVLFELVKTKLVHYYLPAYPAIALWIASALLFDFGNGLGYLRFDTRIGSILIFVASALGAGGLIFVASTMPGAVAVPTAIVIAIGAGGGLIAGLLFRQRRLLSGFTVLSGSIISAAIVLGTHAAPAIHSERLVAKVAKRIADRPDDVIALWLYRDPSLIYHGGRNLPVVDGLRGAPIFRDALYFAIDRGGYLCPVTPMQLKALQADPNLSVDIAETFEGWEPGRIGKRTIHFASVRPSHRAQEFLKRQQELRELAPNVSEILIPLDRCSPAEAANAQRRYPLNAAFVK